MPTTDERKRILQEKADRLKELYYSLDWGQPYVIGFLFGYFKPGIQTEAQLDCAERFWNAVGMGLEPFEKEQQEEETEAATN